MNYDEKSDLSEAEESIAKAIVNAAYKIHYELGPGLLEKIYEVCLVHQLRKAGFVVDRQLAIPIQFDGMTFDEGLRLDILVDKKVVIEVKAVDQVNPVWMAQVLSHLKIVRSPIRLSDQFPCAVDQEWNSESYSEKEQKFLAFLRALAP